MSGIEVAGRARVLAPEPEAERIILAGLDQLLAAAAASARAGRGPGAKRSVWRFSGRTWAVRAAAARERPFRGWSA